MKVGQSALPNRLDSLEASPPRLSPPPHFAVLYDHVTLSLNVILSQSYEKIAPLVHADKGDGNTRSTEYHGRSEREPLSIVYSTT